MRNYASIKRKALLLVTFWRLNTGKPLTEQQLLSFINNRAASLLPNAVESEPNFIELPVSGGRGVYYILTDASLVGDEKLSDNDYKCVAIYFANYEKRFFIYSTVLTNDTNNEIFNQMTNIHSSIEWKIY